MKRVFYGIGLLLIIFSISQYILVAEMKVYFLNDDDMYMIMLDEEFMSISEMEEIAKECDVSFANREIKGSGLKTYVKYKVINPNENIKEGIEPTVFRTGKKEIVFMDSSDTSRFRQIFVVTNEEEKFERVVNKIKQEEYNIFYDKVDKINMTFSMLFTGPLLKFFVLAGVLLIISIVSYYVFRLKEIGILSLNGWTSKEISEKIMYVILKRLFMGFIIPMVLALTYILINNYRIIGNYIYICFIVFGIQCLICTCSAMIASFLIKRINHISAVKNKKNNKAFFSFLIFAKIVTVVLLFVEITSLSNEIGYSTDLNKTYNAFESNDLYVVKQSEALGYDTVKHMEKACSKLLKEDVYNYSYSEDYTLSSKEIREIKKKGYINDKNNYIYCSYNFLQLLKVKDRFGRYITEVDVTDKGKVCVLLIPWHYVKETKKIEKIKEDYHLNYDTVKIMYIEDGQKYINYTTPGRYTYDPIICVEDIDKRFSHDVMLTKSGKETFDNILKENNMSSSTIQAVPLMDYYNEAIMTNGVTLLRNAIYIMLAIISYIIVTITIIIIYFELRKKQIGVYMLQGRYPLVNMLILPIINIAIVTISAMIINKYLLYVNIIEIIIYGCLLHNYLRKKAVLAIKGE